jgi:hypothetical protein
MVCAFTHSFSLLLVFSFPSLLYIESFAALSKIAQYECFLRTASSKTGKDIVMSLFHNNHKYQIELDNLARCNDLVIVLDDFSPKACGTTYFRMKQTLYMEWYAVSKILI